MKNKLLFGFHAVTARLRHNATSIDEIFIDASRQDKRMQELIKLAESVNVRIIQSDGIRLSNMIGSTRHQGVVASAQPISVAHNIDELLESLHEPALLLILDNITDPHNLGACLRVASGAGVHAIIAPKDRCVGLNATAAKVASGAAETVPYITVTNLARTMRELKELGVWITGTSDDAPNTIYEHDFTGPTAIVMGSEGEGMRRLTRDTCDTLISIPMLGAVDSLNISVASGVCLYEARRQRITKAG